MDQSRILITPIIIRESGTKILYFGTILDATYTAKSSLEKVDDLKGVYKRLDARGRDG